MPKIAIHFSAPDIATIEAAAGRDESCYAYVKRVALAHARGEWKANGVEDLRDVIERLQAVPPEPNSCHTTSADPELFRQLSQTASALNLLAKVVLSLQADQKRMLESHQALTTAISEAL